MLISIYIFLKSLSSQRRRGSEDERDTIQVPYIFHLGFVLGV